MEKKLKLFVFLLLWQIFIVGCAAKKQIALIPEQKPYLQHNIPGIFHSVKRGETLWRISQLYKIELEKLVDINKIPDATKIEVGQRVFIPDSLRQDKKEEKNIDLSQSFIWPCKGTVINYFNQIKQNTTSRGIDILTSEGQMVVASAAGKIIFASENLRGYGKAIIIQHPNSFSTVYTCNQKNLARIGDYVRQGQIIARAGKTGRTTRSILHFELRKNNKPQNPLYYLP